MKSTTELGSFQACAKAMTIDFRRSALFSRSSQGMTLMGRPPDSERALSTSSSLEGNERGGHMPGRSEESTSYPASVVLDRIAFSSGDRATFNTSGQSVAAANARLTEEHVSSRSTTVPFSIPRTKTWYLPSESLSAPARCVPVDCTMTTRPTSCPVRFA